VCIATVVTLIRSFAERAQGGWRVREAAPRPSREGDCQFSHSPTVGGGVGVKGECENWQGGRSGKVVAPLLSPRGAARWKEATRNVCTRRHEATPTRSALAR